MDQLTRELMSVAIMKRLRGTSPGHCVRVDFFDRQRANDLCDVMEQEAQANGIALYILTSFTHAHTGQRYITTDRAIELRNRKSERLCLFIPSDLVDAAFSSLANSFAPIDGGDIQREAIQQLYSTLTPDAQSAVRSVLRVLKTPLHVSLESQLAFYAAVAEHDREQNHARIGTALWQVGLIVDNGDDWVQRLGRNREATIQLSLPRKIQSSTVERVDSLGVNSATRAKLITFLQKDNKSVNDVKTWSQQLSGNPDTTLDTWVFPKEDPSNLTSVTIQPLVNAATNVVEKYTGLNQEAPGGSLYASFGPKEGITVRWKTDPPKPSHLDHWRVELIPAHNYHPDEDDEIDLPQRDVSASRRSFKLSLDMELDPENLPMYPLCVRVTPLDVSGSALPVSYTHLTLPTNREV